MSEENRVGCVRLVVPVDDGNGEVLYVLDTSKYPRLQAATWRQIGLYRWSSSGMHWDELDEDISFEALERPEKV